MLTMRDYTLQLPSLCDQITVLNFSCTNQRLLVSQSWYRAVVKYGLWHDCYFDIVVSQHKFTPLRPEPIINF